MSMIKALIQQGVQVPRAGALVIASEILNGKVEDKNISTLATVLDAQGIYFERAEVIPDDPEIIIDSINRFRGYGLDCIFTTGGIGTTHDDITYQCVSDAYGDTLAVDEETVRLMKESGIYVNKERLKMATFPSTAQMIRVPKLWTPVVLVNKETYIFPGIPKLFEKLLAGAIPHLPKGVRIIRKAVYTPLFEGDFSDRLAKIQSRVAPLIEIGSYPLDNGMVKLTVDGADPGKVSQTIDMILAEITPSSVSPSDISKM